jgi:uncharacterized protein (TIGR02217 family)
MSTALFPSSLKGFDIKVKRQTIWSTLVQTSASGKEQRARFWTTPRWYWELTVNFLRQSGFSANTTYDELAKLQTFFNSVCGQWDSFLFVDPVNGTPSNVSFGTGDAATTSFQLVDNEGWLATYIQGTPTVYVAGTATSAFTLNSTTGIVTFGSAPAEGATLTWSGTFARVVRFDDDTMDFDRFLQLAWEGGEVIKIRSVK